MKVDFLTPLCVEAGEGDNEWVLWTDFSSLITDDSGATTTIVVPKGFVTDLASVPRLPGMYMLFGGRARKSAVLHDWLYSNHIVPRNYADRVLFSAMRNEESLFTRGMMWLGVRMFGGSHYRPPPGANLAPQEIVDRSVIPVEKG